MRLWGITMVRNEADVIEAFVRHNLAVLDGVAIVDHDSIDATPEILSRLCAEGLALHVERFADPAYRQSEIMTSLARRTLAERDADFVFALDADEFLKVSSRPALESVLGQVPPGLHGALEWLTYVPDQFPEPGVSFGGAQLQRRLKTEPHGLFKVVVGRSLLERPRDVIAVGNHCVQDPAAAPQMHAILHRDVAAVAHCPVRSRAQLEGKIIVGYLAHLAARPSDRRLANHWRELYADLRDGATLTDALLREIACNYGASRNAWRPAADVELVDDPVRFASEQRYRRDALPDPLRMLMHFTERLIESTTATNGAPPNPG